MSVAKEMARDSMTDIFEGFFVSLAAPFSSP